MKPKERRKDMRIDSINLLDITVTEDQIAVNQGMGRTLNISESGILLETHFSVDLNSSLGLDIAIENHLIHLTGNVIHCEPSQDKKFKIGLQYLDIDQSALQVIRKLIKIFRQQKD